MGEDLGAYPTAQALRPREVKAVTMNGSGGVDMVTQSAQTTRGKSGYNRSHRKPH
jgi:hypothetical protein